MSCVAENSPASRLDDLVGVLDPDGASRRRDDASVRHGAQRDQHDDRDAEPELQPPSEMSGPHVVLKMCAGKGVASLWRVSSQPVHFRRHGDARRQAAPS